MNFSKRVGSDTNRDYDKADSNVNKSVVDNSTKIDDDNFEDELDETIED